VAGVEQAAGADFRFSPAPRPCDDFHVISWAHYPSGFYDLLRQAGVDGTIAYRDGDSANVLDNNFNFSEACAAADLLGIVSWPSGLVDLG